ncbi:MAG: hypothetical protein JSV43_08580, partial [Methanobacteriota archaeon]
ISALDLKESDRDKALELAEEAFESAKSSVDAFAPVVEIALEIKDPKKDDWSEGKITLNNTGKALAKNVVVEILGGAEVEEIEPIETLGANATHEIPLKIKITGTGDVPLAIKVSASRIFDEQTYEFETAETISLEKRPDIQVEIADKSGECPVCRGSIKEGLKVVKCKKCGEVLHELCARSAETCPKCNTPLA